MTVYQHNYFLAFFCWILIIKEPYLIYKSNLVFSTVDQKLTCCLSFFFSLCSLPCNLSDVWLSQGKALFLVKLNYLQNLNMEKAFSMKKDATKQLSSIDNNKLNLTGTQLSKPPVTRSLASVSDTSPENTSAQSGSVLSSQSRTSSLLGVLEASPQRPCYQLL